jgi:hypothetical protein
MFETVKAQTRTRAGEEAHTEPVQFRFHLNMIVWSQFSAADLDHFCLFACLPNMPIPMQPCL